MCGCPDAPTSRLNGDETCRVCMDRPPDFPAGAVDLSEFGLDGVPCAFFETIANQDDETPCALYQASRGSCCTMPTVPPTAPANLQELCDADTIAADLGAYLACVDVCVEASCCEDSCSTNSGCLQYFPCLVLGSVEPPEETDAPNNGTTTEGEGTATSLPTQEQQGIEDTSGANNTSWVSFQLLFSILLTMTAVGIAE